MRRDKFYSIYVLDNLLSLNQQMIISFGNLSEVDLLSILRPLLSETFLDIKFALETVYWKFGV